MSLKNAGIESDEAILFFGKQVEVMQSCKPNYGPHTDNPKKRLKYSSPYWIMRGFYPDTPMMFKIVMIDTSNGKKESFYAKCTIPTIQTYRQFGATVSISQETIKEIMTNKANQILVDDDDYQPHVVIKQRTPKCMSPKGSPIFNLSKKKKKK